MQIQHADNISNKKNHNIFNINSNIKYMSELTTTMK